MRRWRELFFSALSVAILVVIGFKLHELDMPVARFVRSFDINAVNRIGDSVALIGQGVLIGVVFAFLALAGWWWKQDRWKETGLRGLVALFAVTVTVQLLKHLIGRPRPRFAHGDDVMFGPSLTSGLDSFPSGHTINAFAAGAVLTRFFPHLGVFLFLVGGLVGISRVVRGSHFLTDVYTGAIAGLLIGTVVSVGFSHWRDQALPQLVRVGVPWIVGTFFVIWIILHPAPAWPQQRIHLAVGAGCVFFGILLRIGGFLRYDRKSYLRGAGNMFLLIGIAVASGPWWMAALIAAAYLPRLILFHPSDNRFWERKTSTRPQWKHEAFAASAAMLGIVLLHFLQGMLPLAS
jgi:membrane-associated phospholipid phosphatase